MCLCDTHLVDNDIDIHGYTWFGFNRSVKNIRAPKGSGGVGILLKNWIVNEFTVSVFDKAHDGVLAISMINKLTNCSIGIIVCYLPPVASDWGRNAGAFFSHITNTLYAWGNYGHIIVCVVTLMHVLGTCQTLLLMLIQ